MIVLYTATVALLEMLWVRGKNRLRLYGVDLNFLGCPQKCAATEGFGAFLESDVAVDCIKAMRRAIDEYGNHNDDSSGTTLQKNNDNVLPKLSAKIRLLATNAETVELAKQLQTAGCDNLLAVHCRRRGDKHNGIPDLEAGRQVVTALSIPVIINGGEIGCMDDVEQIIRYTGASAVMVARGFLANPRWLVSGHTDPASLAAEYLSCCEEYPPPSPLYIQLHLRWIFRKYLVDKNGGHDDYSDWRVRLWTFLVRPYLETLYQFQLIVALYVRLSGGSMPASLRHLPEPTFQSIRHARKRSRRGADGRDTILEVALTSGQ